MKKNKIKLELKYKIFTTNELGDFLTFFGILAIFIIAPSFIFFKTQTINVLYTLLVWFLYILGGLVCLYLLDGMYFLLKIKYYNVYKRKFLPLSQEEITALNIKSAKEYIDFSRKFVLVETLFRSDYCGPYSTEDFLRCILLHFDNHLKNQPDMIDSLLSLNSLLVMDGYSIVYNLIMNPWDDLETFLSQNIKDYQKVVNKIIEKKKGC